MGTTASGLYYPDAGTTLNLATILAAMQSSAETALANMRSDLTQSWPQISMTASGSTRQVVPNNTVTYLTGNSAGWSAYVNTGGTFMSATAGVGATPIHINKPGKYLVSFEVHNDIGSDPRSFINVLLTGALTSIKRVSFAHDDTVAATAIFDINAVPVNLGIQEYMIRTDGISPNINQAFLECYKMP